MNDETPPKDVASLLKSIAAKKARLDQLRPLSPEALTKLDHYYNIELTYASNAIEGNTLSPVETTLVIEQGITMPDLSPAETTSVLAHECAHEILHRGARRAETNKTIRETEAEAVAFVVCHAIGLETGTAASDYIQLWQGDKATLSESLQFIQSTAIQILTAIGAAEDGLRPTATL